MNYNDIIDFAFMGKDEVFQPPYFWKNNFKNELKLKFDIFKIYSDRFFFFIKDDLKRQIYLKYQKNIDNICDGLLRCLDEYYKGLPQKAYLVFDNLLKSYIKSTFLNHFGFN